MTRLGRSTVPDMSLRRRSLLLGGVGGAAALATLGSATPAAAQPEPPQIEFDFDTGNFLRDLFAPTDPGTGVEDFFGPMDVTIIEWLNHVTTIGWFDAVAPYHPTAVGVHTRLGRRPSSESATNRNKNISALHATYQVIKAVAAEREPGFRQLMTLLGLNPGDESEDPTSPVGIGNLAGKGAVAAAARDGMNVLGDEGRRYHPQPYADYTGYEPVNTAFELVDPSRWQPQLTPHRRRLGEGPADKGIFAVQQFVTPQLRLTAAHAVPDPDRFRIPPPYFTRNPRSGWYRRAVDEVLGASASLTDEQKMAAEFFDNKVLALGIAVIAAARAHDDELGVEGWIHLWLTSTAATFDAMVVVWHQKARFDAVRPVSAVGHVYGSRPVTAWGGAGIGTVDDIPGNEWRSYLNVGDHPEYPSASASLCAAQAQAARRFFGSDVLAAGYPIPAGRSLVEPGITPANDIELHWPTWTDFVNECAASRFWGGVHFRKTQQRSVPFGEQFGDLAYEFVQRHVNGDVQD